MNPNEAPKVCKCPHHKVMPIAVILLALAFLAADFNWLSWGAVNIIWPILLIIAVAPKLACCKCCGSEKKM